MKRFPQYFNHESAKITGCFNCKADLSGQKHKESGYPSGKYQVKCPKCEYIKFYDVDNYSKHSDMF